MDLWDKLLERKSKNKKTDEDKEMEALLQAKIAQEAEANADEKEGIVTGGQSMGSLLTGDIAPAAMAQQEAPPNPEQQPDMQAPPPPQDDAKAILSGGLSNGNIARTFAGSEGGGDAPISTIVDEVDKSAQTSSAEKDALRDMLAEQAKEKGDMDKYLKIMKGRR